MVNERRISFGIYVLIGILCAVVLGTLVFLLGSGPHYATPAQIEAYVQSQSADCRPIARAKLRRKLVEGREPLRPSDLRGPGPMREVDVDDCRSMNQQLSAVDADRASLD